MLGAIERIEQYTRDKSFEDFRAEPMLRDSVERNIERISEASRHLTAEVLETHPEIPWRAVADIGNVLRHAYDDVDAGQTWRVVENDLDRLRAAIVGMIAGLETGE